LGAVTQLSSLSLAAIDSGQLTVAMVGLAGVIVGASIGASATLWLSRRSEVAAIKLLYFELQENERTLSMLRESREAGGHSLSRGVWDEYRLLLAGPLKVDEIEALETVYRKLWPDAVAICKSQQRVNQRLGWQDVRHVSSTGVKDAGCAQARLLTRLKQTESYFTEARGIVGARLTRIDYGIASSRLILWSLIVVAAILAMVWRSVLQSATLVFAVLLWFLVEVGLQILLTRNRRRVERQVRSLR